jgi:hypothetical protein
MADRVRAYGLGRTYRSGAWDDLRSQDRALRAEGAQHCRAGIEAFMASFSREQTEKAVRHAMGYGSGVAVVPRRVCDAVLQGGRP